MNFTHTGEKPVSRWRPEKFSAYSRAERLGGISTPERLSREKEAERAKVLDLMGRLDVVVRAL
jgi:hypothetical protein